MSLIAFQNLILDIPVSDNVIEFAVNFVRATRPTNSLAKITKKYIEWGAGPRASSFLILASKAKAALSAKASPSIDDVKSIIKPVLRHRIILNFNAEAEGMKVDDILDQLIKEINLKVK